MIPYLNNTDHPEKRMQPPPQKRAPKYLPLEIGKARILPSMLSDNQRLILSGLFGSNRSEKTEGLVYLGRMMLSSGFAPEASGYFDLAQHYTSDLSKPGIQSIAGVCRRSCPVISRKLCHVFKFH